MPVADIGLLRDVGHLVRRAQRPLEMALGVPPTVARRRRDPSTRLCQAIGVSDDSDALSLLEARIEGRGTRALVKPH